ncbi:QsdR family transcriptional regulator [Pseudonocardia sp. ICBG1293]|uniref:QsdR family transcriptional regulator n=1 Tax=Pseudonocardia sp. ICBG1293 TaxID=2844382 RepID=UPI001CCE2BC1|nr:QsdR family transcriptional regulator [Pseudonocardia sp. ICBG1293]
MSGRSTATDGDLSGGTTLRRQLDHGGSIRPRATALDALHLAHRWFQAGRRIDIRAIAAELGVSRVTLHRWVGTREQLLVEVLWLNADRSIDRTADGVRADSPARSWTAEILSRWAADVVRHPGIRHLQETEAELLARLLTQDASEFQRRVTEKVAGFLAEDIAVGRVTIELEPQELAYATVRIVESFVHTPAITGGAPDPEQNARVLRALLR